MREHYRNTHVPSVLLHTPPAAAPRKIVTGLVARRRIARVRPPAYTREANKHRGTQESILRTAIEQQRQTEKAVIRAVCTHRGGAHVHPRVGLLAALALCAGGPHLEASGLKERIEQDRVREKESA